MFKNGLVNFLDQDLLNIFQPWQWFLTPFGTARILFYGNLPQLPKNYILYTILMLILVTVAYYYKLTDIYFKSSNVLGDVMLASAYYFLYIINLAYAMCCEKVKIINLLYLIQEIDRQLSLPKVNIYYSNHKKKNIIKIISLFTFHMSLFCFEMCFAYPDAFLNVCITLMLVFIKIVSDIELLYFVNVVSVISSRLQYFNCLLEAKCGLEVTGKKIESFAKIDYLICYRKIMYALKLINKIWCNQVNYCCKSY